jgi:hypothetical protein
MSKRTNPRAFQFLKGLALVSWAVLTANSVQFETALAGQAPVARAQQIAPGLGISITWDHPGPAVGSDETITYYIKRDGGAGPVVLPLTPPPRPYPDSSVEAGKTYIYRVCANYNGDEELCSARVTIDAPAAPAQNLSPPTITNDDVTADSISVYWRINGDYEKILAQLADQDGNVHQTPNLPKNQTSYKFGGLRSGVKYRVILKGCVGAKCGPWSPDKFYTTLGENLNARKVECNGYADQAMGFVQQAKGLNCPGLSGTRWSDDRGFHFNWCMGLSAENKYHISTELLARKTLVANCAGKGKADCEAYTATAMKQVAQNRNLKCGNTGDRWSTDRAHHLNWCMGLAPPEIAKHHRQTETAARDTAIKNCTGIMYEKPLPEKMLPKLPYETYKDRKLQTKP